MRRFSFFHADEQTIAGPKRREWGSFSDLILLPEGGRGLLKLLWLAGLRMSAGLCDLFLAIAMYVTFVLLQGRSPEPRHWWLPSSIFSAALVSAMLVIVRSVLEIISIRSVLEYVHGLYTQFVIRLTRGYTEMRWQRFVQRNRSDLLNTTVHTAREAAFFYNFVIELVASIVVVAAMACGMIYRNPEVACALFGITAMLYGINRFWIRERVKEAGSRKEHLSRLLQRTLSEMLSSGKEIRTYSNHEFFYRRVREQSKGVAHETERVMLLPQISRTLADQGVVLVFLAVIVFVEMRHGDVHRMLSLLVYYFVLSRRLLPLISQIAFTASQLQGSLDSVRIVAGELSDCELNPSDMTPAELPGPGLVLELDQVCFAFDGQTPVLQNMSLRQQPGELFIIRGESGSGKSCLLNLIAGVSQATAGTIRVDRSSIAYVPQEIVLLDDSIRNNLLFGESGRSDEELRSALVLAMLDDVVTAQPEGLDTRVGDNGILFSGGERQRLGLARAILRHVDLLLLDEATSALDEKNEAQVLKNLRDSGRAVLAVTHRVYATQYGDREFHLEDGRLLEDLPVYSS